MTDEEIDALPEAELEAKLTAAYGADATGCCSDAAACLGLLINMGCWVKLQRNKDGAFSLKVDDKLAGKYSRDTSIMKAVAKSALKSSEGLKLKRDDTLAFQHEERARLAAQLRDTDKEIAKLGG